MMRNTKEKKMKFAIVENAKRQARLCFLGIAIPTVVKSIDGEMVQVEKVLKFNRTALKNIGKASREKVDPRMIGGEDNMIVKVGKPGSRERIEELAKQYSVVTRHEISPFGD
jgi:tRNA U54 and U55 pseudouridine synthase Pus10